MPFPFGRDYSRLVLAGIGLLSVTLLSAGCAGKSPLAFLKPKPAASKTASANKLASTGAPAVKPPAKQETVKPEPVKSGTVKSSGAPKKAEPRKAEPLSPEQLATAPLRPSDRLGPGFWIQLAVHFKAKGGEAAWKSLSSKHRALLGGEAHAIKRVDLGKQGRFYRVLAGPYAARGPALEKCARLKRARVACFVINQDGRVRSASVARTPKPAAPKTVAPKPPATEIPAAAAKPRNRAAPRNAAITATPALVKPAPRRQGKTAKKKTGTPAAKKKRAADLPFQRSDSIPGIAK